MKKLHLLLSALLMTIAACQPSAPQLEKAVEGEAPATAIPIVDTSIYETFTIQDGDTTYLMKKYYLCFLKTGPNRS